MSGVILSIASFALSLLLAGGGAIFFRRFYSQTLSSIQERVITAQRQESQVMGERIRLLEAELESLRATLATLKLMLRRRGLILRIHGDYITFLETGPQRETTVRVHRNPGPSVDLEVEEEGPGSSGEGGTEDNGPAGP